MKSIERLLLRPSPEARAVSIEDVLEALGRTVERTPRAVPPRAPFVGRDAEIRMFRDMLDALMAGRPGPRVLHVEGPEGIGRTRLLQEMKWEAQLHTAVFEAWTCAKSPVERMVQQALRSSATTLESVAGVVRAHAALASGPTPIVLIVDDVQDLPAQERERLGALSRLVQPEGPLLMVCAEAPHATLARGGDPRLTLTPLDLATTAEWLGEGFPPERRHESRGSSDRER
jgi:hypothetical protein